MDVPNQPCRSLGWPGADCKQNRVPMLRGVHPDGLTP